MIGRGERYPLARRVTEDEIAPACFGLGNVPCRCSVFGSTAIRSIRNPGWRGIRGALATYPGLRCVTPTAYLANLFTIHTASQLAG